METTRSEQLFKKAVDLIPGGVNSPVRAFGNVGMTPRFIASANGVYLTDADGNKYLDYVGSWGPMILGHTREDVLEKVFEACKKGLSFGAATEAEVEMAELICSMVPSIEMVRMVNSGTEAVMSAIRAARGYTGRNKIIKFEGCYHGHSDALLVKAGSGVMTAGVPDSSGVPAGATEDTLLAPYNDLEAVEKLFDTWGSGIAAVIFDEVITGFRLARGGAQEYFGIQSDLTTYGKIIGGGMPVGAYGGRRDIMEVVSPVGQVYQAGTLSGNPVAMAAGLTQLRYLNAHPEVYTHLEALGERLYGGMEKLCQELKLPHQINHVGSLGCMFFTEQPVVDYTSAKSSDTKAFAAYFRYMLEHGIYLASSQFEAMFLSDAHTDEQVDETLSIMRNYFEKTVQNA